MRSPITSRTSYVTSLHPQPDACGEKIEPAQKACLTPRRYPHSRSADWLRYSRPVARRTRLSRGGTLLFNGVWFFRATRGKTTHKRHAAVRPEPACPELVEGSKGRRKRGF